MRRFVKYSGYGNAAGLLATRGLLGGQSAQSSSCNAQYSSDSDSDTEEYLQVRDRINPVTGRVETQQPDPMEGMSEEEKEEEAKQLIKLFSKLSRSVKHQGAVSFTQRINDVNQCCFICRDDIIKPMGVDSEGRLIPLAGLRENSISEEGHSGSENEVDEEK